MLDMGSSRRNGYGCFKFRGGVHDAHVLSYRHFSGDIPLGKEICHTCDIKSCVNPEHLFVGTRRENINDMINKGRHQHGINHHSAILTEEIVLQMRELHEKNGVGCRKLARQFGIGKTTAHSILDRRTWKHI
jgi:hypothetical protein